MENLYMEAEDSLSQDLTQAATEIEQLKVAVIKFPRLSNSTDFDPLSLHPQVDLSYITNSESLQGFDLIILPGSRSVAADLGWLKKTGLSQAIERHLRYGGKVLGICGGFQMLGRSLFDPDAVESREAQTQCLGFLDMCTTMAKEKTLTKVSGKLTLGGAAVSGY
ncbi:MAG: hypothetical protein HC888_14550 [Candidatus Competibacteraceae bacterium]|nr:hypothetical protein [Candidatus Competibacteraceae bacterium]